MIAIHRRALALPAALLLLAALPVTMALVRLVQIPSGTLPKDVAYFTATPLAHFAHAAAGAAFGVLGPLQFIPAIRARAPRIHRASGRVFAIAGLVLGISGLRMIAAFPDSATPVLDAMRIAAALGLIVALALAIAAIRRRDIARHRAMMIRAYALGVGGFTVILPTIAWQLVAGNDLDGLAGDLVFVACWLASLAVAERAVHLSGKQRRILA